MTRRTHSVRVYNSDAGKRVRVSPPPTSLATSRIPGALFSAISGFEYTRDGVIPECGDEFAPPTEYTLGRHNTFSSLVRCTEVDDDDAEF